MKRSAAPSQIQSNKRSRFCVPFKTPQITKEIPSGVASEETVAVTNRFSEPCKLKETFRSLSKSSHTVSSGDTANCANFSKSISTQSKFAVPTLKDASQSCLFSKKTENTENDAADSTSTSRYLSVVWCKLSKKKHKKWEGDAVLITSGRSVSLYDMEGKQIGKGTGYKASELISLKEDETLKIGGKEILVMSVLSENDYKTGKCFVDAGVKSNEASSALKQHNNGVSSNFKSPLSEAASSSQVRSTVSVRTSNQDQATVNITPRYDPTAPGALVMPRPSSNHQWLNNKKNLPIVDVVVDPFLTKSLRPHQKDGITFLYECVMGYKEYSGCGCILADDMGLGKTLQCITLIWILYKQGPYGGKPVLKRTLIITPGSLVKNWCQEFKKWLGTERLSVYAVSSEKRIEDFVNTTVHPVLVISYEMFIRSFELIQKMNFDLIVCDEGHRLKNTTIKTTSLIMNLPSRRRVVLTGTPIQNDLQEFFSIVEFCNPGVLGTSTAFRRVYEEPIVASRQPSASKQQLLLGEERAVELSRLTKLFILRRTQEINNAYLPPKSEIVVFCKPRPLQLHLYRRLLSCQLIRYCLAGISSGSPHLICINALKQLCNHPKLIYSKIQTTTSEPSEDKEQKESIYDGLLGIFPEGFEKDLTEHSGKLTVLSGLLRKLHSEGSREKIVLVSNHTKTLDMIQEFCDSQNYKYCRLDGQTATLKRQEIVQHFNSRYSQETVFLLSSKAGGVGLNLVGASRLVLYDIDWNPANDLQAMARVWRDGQPRKVCIYRFLTTGTIEEKVYQRQISKQGLSGTLMDTRDKTDVQFSLEDLKDLFSLNEVSSCETHDLLNCSCSGNIDDGDDIHTESTEPVRACQLGFKNTIVKTKKTNLSMDQLMEWKHLSAQNLDDYPEWYLTDSKKDISFLFWNETKTVT